MNILYFGKIYPYFISIQIFLIPIFYCKIEIIIEIKIRNIILFIFNNSTIFYVIMSLINLFAIAFNLIINIFIIVNSLFTICIGLMLISLFTIFNLTFYIIIQIILRFFSSIILTIRP
jgi:hypothetical protein